MRRVVITGMGIVSPLGDTIAAALTSLRESRSGIRFHCSYREMGLRSQVGGFTRVDLKEQIDKKNLRFMGNAAVILSVLGAVHWGLALSSAEMRPPLARQSLLWGVMPSLLGWLALVLLFVGFAAWLVFALLIADLLLARLMDGALLRQHASNHRGYLELRTRLTVGATLALAIALAGSL